MEKRAAYVKKVCEKAKDVFIDGDKPNVEALIKAGAAEFKEVIAKSATLDSRLTKIIKGIIDVQYGGMNGLS